MLDATWRKSSRSNNNGSCVEIRRVATVIEIRDTKDREGGTLSVSTEAWRGFIAGVHSGEFDQR